MFRNRVNRHPDRIPFFSVLAVVAVVPLAGCVDLEGDDPPELSDVSQAVASTLTSFGGGAPAEDLFLRSTFVYWSRGGDIFKVSKSGGSVTTLCTGCAAHELTVDASNVFYASPSTSDVAKVSTSGGFPLFLATSPAAPAIESNVIVDASNVYWVGGTTIYRCAIGGSAVTTVYAGSASQIAADTNNIYQVAGGQLRKIAKSTLAVTNVVAASGTDLRVEGGVATWRDTNVIKRISTSGGTVTTFNSAVSGNFVNDMAVDATNVYFIQKPSGGVGNALVRKIPISTPSATPTTLYTIATTKSPGDLQADGSFIYWSDTDGVWKADP